MNGKNTGSFTLRSIAILGSILAGSAVAGDRGVLPTTVLEASFQSGKPERILFEQARSGKIEDRFITYYVDEVEIAKEPLPEKIFESLARGLDFLGENDRLVPGQYCGQALKYRVNAGAEKTVCTDRISPEKKATLTKWLKRVQSTVGL